jgi:hypothetical protein
MMNCMTELELKYKAMFTLLDEVKLGEVYSE